MMRARARIVVAASATLLLGGCHGYLVPFDERPLPCPRPAELRGGARLDVDSTGDLVLRPPAGDVEAALGVALVVSDGGLVVTHRLRPDAELRPGDLIVHAAAVLPDGGSTILAAHQATLARAEAAARHQGALGQIDRRMSRDLSERGVQDAPGTTLAARPEDELDAFDPALAVLLDGRRPSEVLPGLRGHVVIRNGRSDLVAIPTRDGGIVVPAMSDGSVEAHPPGIGPADVRARAGNHPVRRLDDLRGYLSAASWLELDLVIAPPRDDASRPAPELVVRVVLREETGWVPVRAWRPELTRWHGVDLAEVRDWPPERRPTHAEDDDLLVVRIARDAPAARAGLRPLDAVPRASLAALLAGAGDEAASRPFDVRKPDGSVRRLVTLPREPVTQVEVPPFVTWEEDTGRGHVGIGPFDGLVHVSWHVDYSPTTDAYERTWRWSVCTFFQGGGLDGPGGARETGGVNLLSIDGARMAYWAEWRAIDDEAARRRGGGPR